MQGHTGTLEKAATKYGSTWPPLPSSLASGSPKSMRQAHMSSVGAAAPPREGGPTEKVQCGLFGNARKRGRREEGIGPRFCSSVPHHQEGYLTGFMQGQGRRAERSRPTLPANYSSRAQGQGKPMAVAPGPYESPLQVAPSMVRVGGHAPGWSQRRRCHIPITRDTSGSLLAGRPTPQCSPRCLYPHPLFRCERGHCALSVTRHQSCALHCRLACDCQEPPD